MSIKWGFCWVFCLLVDVGIWEIYIKHQTYNCSFTQCHDKLKYLIQKLDEQLIRNKYKSESMYSFCPLVDARIWEKYINHNYIHPVVNGFH